MKMPHYLGFRFTILFVAALLAGQCVWLLLPELYRPGIAQLPTNASSAAAATKDREAATHAAAIGALRGDLWEVSAFTYADLLWSNRNESRAQPQTLASARASLLRALNDAPHQFGAWLMLAGLALRYPSPGQNAIQLLKMSYYTGPSERDLIPLRLGFVAQSDFTGDPEMRQFVSRDVRLLLAGKENSAIIAAYNAALPAGKGFIEQAVREADPSGLEWLHSGEHPSALPN